MKRRAMTLWVFITIFALSFSIDFKGIYSLSKDPNGMEDSINYLLNYVKKNGLNETEYDTARKIFAKYRIYRSSWKEKNYRDLVLSILKENKDAFLKFLIMKSEKLDGSFRYVFFIFNFNEDMDEMYKFIMGSDFEHFLPKFRILRHLWKIPMYSRYLRLQNTDRFVQTVIDLSLKNPTLFDYDTATFLSGFMKKENVKFLDLFLESKIKNVDENEYIPMFRIMNFYMDMSKELNMKPNPDLLAFYTDLSFYLSLKRSIASFRVDFSSTRSFVSKMEDIMSYIETFESLRIKKRKLKEEFSSVLEDIYLGMQFKDIRIDQVDLEMLKKHLSSIKDTEFLSRMALILSALKEKKMGNTVGKSGYTSNTSLWILFVIPVSFIIGILILPGKLKVIVLKSLGMKRLALFFFKRIVMKNPSSPILHAELGMMYEKIGMEEQARLEYRIAMKLIENREKGRSNLKFNS